MERLRPPSYPRLRIVRSSNRIHMWMICQKWFFVWEVGSVIATMKERIAKKILWTGMTGWEGILRANCNLPETVVRRMALKCELCGYVWKSCLCCGWWEPCLNPRRPVLNPADTGSHPPQCLEIYLMDLMFTVPSLTMSQLLFSPSAFYFPCTEPWLNSWVPSFLNELSVSWSFICLQVVNCNFDHSWVLFCTAALPVA